MSTPARLASSSRPAYDRDYFERGIAAGVSLFENYRWIPELTIPLCADLKERLHLHGKVLDYGCAKGFMVKALRLLGVDAYGYDISEYALSTAHSDTAPYLYGGEFVLDGLNGEPWDWVIAKDVLEHLTYADLYSLLRRLKTRRLFVAVPLGDNGRYVCPAYELDTTHHIRRPLDWWQAALERHGFDVRHANHEFGRLKEAWNEQYPQSNGFLIGERSL